MSKVKVRTFSVSLDEFGAGTDRVSPRWTPVFIYLMEQ
jgi:hypothetical protein